MASDPDVTKGRAHPRAGKGSVAGARHHLSDSPARMAHLREPEPYSSHSNKRPVIGLNGEPEFVGNSEQVIIVFFDRFRIPGPCS